MTSSSSTHLDLDALADVLAGETDPSNHLAQCPSCTSRLGELRAAEARVIAVLQTLPPPAVPDDLVDRLTAAIAAEPAPAATAGSVTALPTRVPRRRTWLPAVAAGVLLFSGAGLGYALLSESGGADSDTAGDAGPSVSASGIDYADTAAVTQALPDVLAGTAEVGTGESSAASEARAESGAGGASSSDDAASSSQDAATTMQAPAVGAPAEDPLARLRTTDGLADCLAAVLPPDEPDLQPLALDYASYGGQPALAVVLPDPDPAKLSVYLVGPGCSRADDGLLHFLRIDKP